MHTLAVSHISKHFTLKKALDDVSLSFESGQVYALLGENGAGKSTLASLLSGDASPTSGSILLNGSPVAFHSPHDALQKGIAIVRQHPLLVDELTILENCMLGNEEGSFLKKRAAAAKLEKVARAWSLPVRLNAKAGILSAPERLFGTLLANLFRKPRFLLLDEPSATLDLGQRKNLFSTLRLKAHQNGLCVIFITHNIQEALDYADYITILQKGHVVFSKDISLEKPAVSDIEDKLFAQKEDRGFTFAAPPLSNVMKAEKEPAPRFRKEASMLELHNVTVRPANGAAVFDLNIAIPKGKLTCITGQHESGLDTLEDLLTGMLAATDRQHLNGDIFFNGKYVTKLTPRFLRKHRTAIIPSRKMIRASHPELTIAEFLGCTGIKAERILEQVQMDIAAKEKVKVLSGGMLQRLIIARELYSDPAFVIMSSPSYGLDRFSTGKVTETVSALLSHGTTVLVLGDEPSLIPLASNTYKLVSGYLLKMQEAAI